MEPVFDLIKISPTTFRCLFEGLLMNLLNWKKNEKKNFIFVSFM